MPTKALLHVAELAAAARAGSSHGIRSSFEGVNMAGIHASKDGVVGHLHKGLQGLVSAAGVTFVAGEGYLAGPRTVRVGDDKYTGRSLVLATGSYARMLPGLELGPRVLTSTEALRLTEMPERLVVVGGSVIGVEFAFAWRSFGAEVTVVEALQSLVPLEDPALGRQQLERAFRRRGIEIRTGTRFESVKEVATGVVLTLEGSDTVPADLVLVAVGRGPASKGLGLEEQGIALDHGWVVTDERLRTSVTGVYAVGDLVPGLQLAHRGFAHGIFVAEEIAGLEPAVVEDSGIPRVTYCEPEIASVGHTEPQARETYGDVATYEYNLAGNGKIQILGTAGYVKVVREVDGPVVGVHMIGSRMGEQIVSSMHTRRRTRPSERRHSRWPGSHFTPTAESADPRAVL